MYINKAILYGNITRDPELKALPSGGKVVNFSLATNRTYKDAAGQKQEAVEFHNVVFFGKQAETIGQYMKKGSAIMVEGRITTRSWEKDGVKQYRTEVVGEQFQFGPKSGGSSVAPTKSAADELYDSFPDKPIDYPNDNLPDEIPF